MRGGSGCPGARWSATRGTAAVVLCYLGFQAGGWFLRPWRADSWYVAASIAVGVLLGAGVLVVVAMTTPQPVIDVAGGRLRVGRRTIPFENISWATLDAADTKRRRSLWLRFGDAGGLRTGMVLRTARGPAAEDSRARLAVVLERSSVRLPISKDDPEGKFARYNFPGSLTKQQAIDVVRNPPALGETLPILGGTPVPDRLRKLD